VQFSLAAFVPGRENDQCFLSPDPRAVIGGPGGKATFFPVDLVVLDIRYCPL
jgi:hypothetical protein